MKLKIGQRSRFLQKLLTIVAVCVYMFIAFVVGVGASRTEFFSQKLELFDLALKDAPLQKKFPTEYYESLTTWVDDPAKAHDKLILTSAAYKDNPALLLVNRDGKIVHQWDVENKYHNPEVIARHQIQDPSKGGMSSVDDAVLFPNGDVIAILDNRMLHNYRGQRLFRMDKDSKVLWAIEGEFHHEIDLGSDGNIYAMDYELRDSYPVIDYDPNSPTKFLSDVILKVTTDGKILDSWSVPDAFVGTPYEFFLYSFRIDIPTLQKFEFPDETQVFDPIHTNSVQYLDSKLAARLPFAKKDDLLISMRGNSAIAILRPSTGKIVWAAVGLWKHQHNVKLLPSGKIRILDNEGSAVFKAGEEGKTVAAFKTRILDYDPVANKTEVVYFDPTYYDTYSFWRSAHHELEDGSLLFLSTDKSRVLQIAEGKLVWELRGVADRKSIDVAYKQRISIAKPYDKQYLTFITQTPDKE